MIDTFFGRNTRSATLYITLLVMVIAATARLWNIGVSEYRYDEAILSELAMGVLQGEYPREGLPASIGIPLPPTMVYLVAAGYAVTDDPLVITAIIALYNALGCGIFYWLCRRYLAPDAALAAALVFAVTPWALLYSRKIWVPNFHIPLLLIGIALGFRGFVDGKRWAQALCFPFITLPIHFHYSAIALLPLYAWFLWQGRKTLSQPALGISFALAGVMLLPFASVLLNFPTIVQSYLNSRQGGTFRPTLEGFGYLLQYMTGWGLYEKLAGDVADSLRSATFWSPVPGLILGMITLLGGIVGQVKPRYTVFLYMWALLPALTLIPGWTSVFDHYLNLSLPALCVFAGIGVVFLSSKLRQRGIVYGALTLVLAGLFANWAGMLHTLDTAYASSFGTPMHYMNEARNALSSVRDVLIFNADLRHSAWTWKPLLHRQADCVREVIIPEGNILLFPAHPFAAFIPTNIDAYPFLERYRSDDRVTIPLREGEAPFMIHFHNALPVDDHPLTPINPLRFENGAQLMGFALKEKEVDLAWELHPGAVRRDDQYYIHFYDAGGERVGQRDTSFYTGRYWCAGDRLITTIDVQQPPTATHLRIGMYHLSSNGIVGVNVVRADGSLMPYYERNLSESSSE